MGDSEKTSAARQGVAVDPRALRAPAPMPVDGGTRSCAPFPDLQLIYDTAPVGLACITPDCRYLQINQRLTEVCGISVADHIGRSVRDIVPNLADHVEKIVQSILMTGEPITGIEVSGQRADKLGADRCWLTSWHPLKGADGKIVAINIAAEEITERKRAEAEAQAALRASEERWRSVFESSTLGISIADQKLRFVASNAAFQSMLGYTDEELRSLSPLDLIAETEREAARTRLIELRSGERRHYDVIVQYRRKDGASIYVDNYVSTIPDAGAGSPLFLATAIDITARMKVERELRRSGFYLAEAEKISHTGCWARNPGTGELFWSAEEWRIFGLDPATTELSYPLFLEMIHPEDRVSLEATSLQAVREKQPYDIPFRVVLADGSIKHIHSVGNPILDEAGNVIEYIGVSQDVTERKRAEVALQDAQADLARVARLTTMGELAASIAHEINQPLAAVVTFGNNGLRWLARDPPDLAEAAHTLKRIITEANRASDVIGRIRRLLKSDKPEYAGLDVNDAIRDVLALVTDTLQSRGVAVRTHLPADIPLVLGDRVQLQQVVMNLVINGADAMKSIVDRPKVLRVGSQIDAAGSVLVAIEDSGTGIDAGIVDRIFDPLFTTKHNGMGMGLSICRSIVEAHGGRIWVGPGASNGTVFKFTLPIYGEGAEGRQE